MKRAATRVGIRSPIKTNFRDEWSFADVAIKAAGGSSFRESIHGAPTAVRSEVERLSSNLWQLEMKKLQSSLFTSIL